MIDDPTRASRYLAEQLSEAECAEYEAQLVRDPKALAELEATARLKIGLHCLRESGELGELLTDGRTPHASRSVYLALAATVAAMVIGVGLWYPRMGAPNLPVLASVAGALKDPQGHSLPVLATAPLFRTREEAYDAIIQLPTQRGAIKLRVLPSTAVEAARYQATLARIRQDDAAERVVSISDLQPSSEDGFVDVYADTSHLAPGRYRLILTRQVAGNASGESDIFVIKVAPAR